MDASGAFWYVVAGAMVAVGGLLVYWFRRTFRWLLGRIKAEWLAWFAEAVDEHVGPRLEQLRDETQQMADKVAEAARLTAADVAERLEQHTAEEGEIVRAIVRQELAPLVQTMDVHVEDDAAASARVEAHLSHIEKDIT